MLWFEQVLCISPAGESATMTTEETEVTTKLEAEYNVQVEEADYIIEEEEYGAPFLTFTWEEWEEMQKQTFIRFTRFQHAIEQGQIAKALLIALEMHEVGSKWLEEVCAQSKN